MRKTAVLCMALLLCLMSFSASADVYTASGLIRELPMPSKYTEETKHKGTVERLEYRCPAYPLDESVTVEKDLYVYIPYGYDAEKKHNVLYLMHGSGENASYWLGESAKGKRTRAMLDRMAEREEAEPVIVVSCTLNLGTLPKGTVVQGNVPDGEKTFWKELREDVIPLVETRYATFAGGDVSLKSLRKSRNHRGFAGLSLGSTTGLEVMKYDLDIVSNFGNFSAGTTRTEDFFRAMESEINRKLPIHFWYHGEGTGDFALGVHRRFCAAILKNMAGRVFDGTNYAYVEFSGGTHTFDSWLPHLYNCLRLFFRQGRDTGGGK